MPFYGQYAGFGGGGAVAAAYTINQSCLFNKSNSAFLIRTVGSSATNVDKGTISVWQKNCNTASEAQAYVFENNDGTTNNQSICFGGGSSVSGGSSNSLFTHTNSGSITGRLVASRISSAFFRL